MRKKKELSDIISKELVDIEKDNERILKICNKVKTSKKAKKENDDFFSYLEINNCLNQLEFEAEKDLYSFLNEKNLNESLKELNQISYEEKSIKKCNNDIKLRSNEINKSLKFVFDKKKNTDNIIKDIKFIFENMQFIKKIKEEINYENHDLIDSENLLNKILETQNNSCLIKTFDIKEINLLINFINEDQYNTLELNSFYTQIRDTNYYQKDSPNYYHILNDFLKNYELKVFKEINCEKIIRECFYADLFFDDEIIDKYKSELRNIEKITFISYSNEIKDMLKKLFVSMDKISHNEFLKLKDFIKSNNSHNIQNHIDQNSFIEKARSKSHYIKLYIQNALFILAYNNFNKEAKNNKLNKIITSLTIGINNKTVEEYISLLNVMYNFKSTYKSIVKKYKNEIENILTEFKISIQNDSKAMLKSYKNDYEKEYNEKKNIEIKKNKEINAKIYNEKQKIIKENFENMKKIEEEKINREKQQKQNYLSEIKPLLLQYKKEKEEVKDVLKEIIDNEKAIEEKEIINFLKKNSEKVKLIQEKAEVDFVKNVMSNKIKKDLKAMDEEILMNKIKELKIRPNVQSDPERLLSLTKNYENKFNKELIDGDFKGNPFNPLYGFENKHLMKDQRYRLQTYLNEYGISTNQNTYANEFLNNFK